MPAASMTSPISTASSAANLAARRRMQGRISETLRRARHKGGERLAVGGGHGEAELRAPPQHVVGEARPFPGHEVAHFGSGQLRSEGRTESFFRLGVTQNRKQPRA